MGRTLANSAEVQFASRSARRLRSASEAVLVNVCKSGVGRWEAVRSSTRSMYRRQGDRHSEAMKLDVRTDCRARPLRSRYSPMRGKPSSSEADTGSRSCFWQEPLRQPTDLPTLPHSISSVLRAVASAPASLPHPASVPGSTRFGSSPRPTGRRAPRCRACPGSRARSRRVPASPDRSGPRRGVRRRCEADDRVRGGHGRRGVEHDWADLALFSALQRSGFARMNSTSWLS